MWAVQEVTEKKVQRVKFYFPFSREGEATYADKGTSPRGWDFGLLSGDGVLVEQDVSVGLVQAAACTRCHLDVIFGCRAPSLRSLRSGVSSFISPQSL